jgi:cell division protease FtsH
LAKIDKEVGRIIEECYKNAVSIIKKNKTKLDAVAVALLEKENLDEDEFNKIMKG